MSAKCESCGALVLAGKYCWRCYGVEDKGTTHNEHSALEAAVVKLLDIADPGGSGSILVRVEELTERLQDLTRERQQVEAFAALTTEERVAQTEPIGKTGDMT